MLKWHAGISIFFLRVCVFNPQFSVCLFALVHYWKTAHMRLYVINLIYFSEQKRTSQSSKNALHSLRSVALPDMTPPKNFINKQKHFYSQL